MATELAKAYVQIVPSAKGIAGSISSVLGGEAQEAGASAGESVAGNLVGKLKGVLAAAGIGKAVQSAISAGADLEQSIGGIETLFKDSADVVKQYAEKAYETAGLSANDYMQTVTGFSASLLQGLGGDTAKAAEVSNMAITDMSDNANKMGTDMSSIQNAYQGFAKQNYTMLDNLKLGYGGTKEEMARLLQDAQKISGVKYDMNNLSDVYSAIHVIQGELDITGTTAKEASTTISGSMSAMKAAFSNVMGGLALGQDIAPALHGLVETTATFLTGNLIPAVLNIVKALPGAAVGVVKTAVPKITDAVLQFVPQLKTGLTETMPALLQAGSDAFAGMIDGVEQSLPQALAQGTEIVNSLTTGILNNLPVLIDSATQAMTGFLNMLIANLPAILESGASIITNIVTGILNNLPQVILSVSKMVLTLLKSIVAHLPEIIAAGFDILTNLITGIGNALPGIIAVAGDVAADFMDTITSTDWLKLGKDIIAGIISGISSMGGALWDAAVNVAKGAEDAIKDFFGIASPSKLMRDEVGKFIPAGIALGITQNTQPVQDAMKSLSDMTAFAVQDACRVDASVSGVAFSSSGRQSNAASPQIVQNIYAAKQTPVELAATTRAYFQKARWIP